MNSLYYNPLQTYSKQLVELFQKSLANTNPADFLYKHDARTNLFMAESLARLLNKIYDDEEIEKACKAFKKLEDMLGDIDYYDNLQKKFSKNKLIKQAEQEYFIKKLDKAYEKLNEKLLKKDFYQDIFNEMLAFKINFNNEILITKLETQIKREIKEAFDFYSQYPEKFTDLESQVHELRRKLRWISIYSQSLQGFIVLKAGKAEYAWEKEFISQNDAKSPFNKVPVKKGLAKYISFNKKAFYALNTTIERLGEIKDRGLEIEALTKSIKKAGNETSKNPTGEALKQLKVKYTEEDILKESHNLLKSFFSINKIHEKLI